MPTLVEDNHLGTNSPLFCSPATSGKDYFSTSTYQIRDYGENGNPVQNSETDIADIMSAHTSTTNSPIGSMDFSIDPVELDPNFLFNIPGFFA